MSKYTDIIARLEKAEGPDRELDSEINVLLRIMPESGPDWIANFPVWRSRLDGRIEVVHEDGTGGVHWEPKLFTASLDAAIGLVERQIATEGRKLICFFCAGGQLTPFNADKHSPDYHPLAKIDNSVTVGWMAHVAFYCADGGTSGPESYSHGRTAPIAILIALFRALEAQEPTP